MKEEFPAGVGVVVGVTEPVLETDIEDVKEIVLDADDDTAVLFLEYTDSLLPAPQNSELLAAQFIEHCVSGYLTLVLARVFEQ